MKHFKHLIIYLSILSLILVTMFSRKPLKVYADVPSSQLVISHGSSWGNYDFVYSLQRKYFTIEDSTGIPVYDGTPRYFYTDDNETFYILDGAKLFTVVLNRGVGITLKNDLLTSLIQGFFSSINIRDSQGNRYIQGGLYDNNNNFLGYCLNDISGCYYQGLDGSPNIRIPSETVNNVHNYYKHYNDEDKTAVDYFTFICPSSGYINDHWLNTSNYGLANFNALSATVDNLFDINLKYSNADFNIIGLDYSNSTRPTFIGGEQEDTCYIFTNQPSGSNWNNFCYNTGLYNDEHELLFTDLLSSMNALTALSQGYYIAFDAVDPETGNRKDLIEYSCSISTDGDISSSTATTPRFYFGTKQQAYNSYTNLRVVYGSNITIYKSYDVFQAVNIDKTYYPGQFQSTIYNNYNTNNDNSFTVNYEYLDYSITNNTTIYNYGKDDYDDNRDNNGVDTPQINNNITVIIENIIPTPDPSPSPDPEPDPDNPNDDDDINNDNVLSALLTALRHFFHVIGQLLGTILTGIVDILNSILTAIAGIMEDLTGITSFISALFGWIPSPVPEVLAIGISITILFALIKFIRG